MRTPWGQSDHAQQYAPGIVFYGTSSHGGFHLDCKRQAHIKTTFPAFETFAGGPWYEEDEDWRVVAVAWPGLFTDYEVYQAVEGVRLAAARDVRDGRLRGRWLPIRAWLDNLFGTRAGKIAARWYGENSENYRVGSMGGGKVWLSRVKDGQTITVAMAGYPEKLVYTHAEVEAMRDPEGVTA